MRSSDVKSNQPHCNLAPAAAARTRSSTLLAHSPSPVRHICPTASCCLHPVYTHLSLRIVRFRWRVVLVWVAHGVRRRPWDREDDVKSRRRSSMHHPHPSLRVAAVWCAISATIWKVCTPVPGHEFNSHSAQHRLTWPLAGAHTVCACLVSPVFSR
ncbi:hypothetical protein EON67_01080 [archaeon]|nr:MAG: hypothetical protein EON67_01080 [archaeon]